MDVIIEIQPVSAQQAVSGMRADFLKPFGRGWFGRRLGTEAWVCFSAALTHGLGMDSAATLAHTAATERNRRALLVGRWSPYRLRRTLDLAVARAAISG